MADSAARLAAHLLMRMDSEDAAHVARRFPSCDPGRDWAHA